MLTSVQHLWNGGLRMVCGHWISLDLLRVLFEWPAACLGFPWLVCSQFSGLAAGRQGASFLWWFAAVTAGGIQNGGADVR